MSHEDMRYLIAVAGLLVGGYGLITRPMMNKIEAETAKVRVELFQLETRLRTEINNMEKRINERIDAWITRK